MSDTEPIMRDHSDTSEEERNELRKINQDNAADHTIVGELDNAAGSITRPLVRDHVDSDDLAADAAQNDRAQRKP